MTSYQNFFGIDIGKNDFVVCHNCDNLTKSYPNTYDGITAFISDNEHLLEQALCVVEATGGYEYELLAEITTCGFNIHRADSRKVKNFIRSYGNIAKTDRLDAIGLARYAKERADALPLFPPKDDSMMEFCQLVNRRKSLIRMRVAEKNRLKSPSSKMIQ